jgi:hypothetical protein
MTLPAVLFGFLVSSLYGVIYHVFRSDRPGGIPWFLGWSWAGFAAGHLVGILRDWSFFEIGPLNLGMGTIGSAIFLGLGDWLGRREAARQSKV